MRRAKAGCERGQSTVEFALVLPLVVVVVLGVLQVGMIVYAQVSVTHTAREVARALAVDPTVDVGSLVQEVSTLRADDVRISTEISESVSAVGRYVEVEVSAPVPTVSVLLSMFFDTFTVSARARMLIESQ